MKYIHIFFLSLALLPLNISLGVYQANQTPDLINDLKLFTTHYEKVGDLNDLEQLKLLQAISYLAAYRETKKLANILHQNSFAKCFNDSLFETGSILEGQEMTRRYSTFKEELELHTYGYKMPNTSVLVLAKVLIKYAEDYPAMLTKSPIVFIEMAFKDAWGEND